LRSLFEEKVVRNGVIKLAVGEPSVARPFEDVAPDLPVSDHQNPCEEDMIPNGLISVVGATRPEPTAVNPTDG
jgi:hypothetical protein